MNSLRFFTLLWCVTLIGGSRPPHYILKPEQVRACVCNPIIPHAPKQQFNGALIASRFQSLEELKTVIQIDYFNDSNSSESSMSMPMVRLRHCANGREVTSLLESGVHEGDFKDAQAGDFWDKAKLAMRTPYAAVKHRDLKRVFLLARRKPNLFGEGDVAFFDLAQTMEAQISREDREQMLASDTTEKGYLNTFNHMTAQAFVTSFFSEELADFVADSHERFNMPELITGKFSAEQLVDPKKNPMDNYVDLINNEWGQELGKQLRAKHGINRHTVWTPALLADYLNDIQLYYSHAFQIGFQPFRASDQAVIRFATKINLVMEQLAQYS